MTDKKSTSIIDAEDVRLVWKFISGNWLFFIAFPALAALFAYLYTHRMDDIYAAKTEILLKSEATSEYQSQIFRGLTGYYSTYAQITNQKRVIASHDLISKTLDKLNFQVEYYIVGRVKTTEIRNIEPLDISVTLMDPGLYGKKFDIFIVDENNYQIRFEKNGEPVERIHPIGEEVFQNEYLLTVNRNPYISDANFIAFKENHYQFAVFSKDYLVNKYKAALTIENEDYSSILELTIEDGMLIRAKQFLDTLSKVYIDYTIEAQILLNENTLTYIDRQLEGITTILDSIESSLEQYKASRDILDLPREEDEYFKSLVQYETQKRELTLRSQSLASLENYILTSNDERLLPPSIYIFDDDFLRTSLNALYNLQLERARSLIDVHETSPSLMQIDASINELRRNILVYIRNLETAIKDKTEDINKQIADYEAMIRRLPQSQRDLLNIERNLDVNEKMYIYLLEKKANTIIARAGIVPEVSIIEVARPLGVVGPNKSRISYLFIGVGFLIAAFISFIRLLFFDRIENARELKQISKLPIIGGVPKYTETQGNEIAVVAHPKSNVAESFRSIRANLQFIASEDKNRCFLITSLHPGEGKTFCSTNLATIFAKAQKRTLLLDFDMHKPKIHKALNLGNEVGMSTYLTGRTSLEGSIIQSGIDFLDVLTAGPLPPNASELVLSEKVNNLFQEVKEKYDYVIVDTPPLMLISDSMVLIHQVDLPIFVMNTNKASRSGVRYLEDIVDSNNIKRSSLILNNIKLQRWRYYYGKYSYNYGYGYGYGYGYSYGKSDRK